MTWSMLLKALARIPSESAEDITVYVIFSTYIWTAHVSYWNGQALLQLCAQCQDRNDSQCSIMVILDLSEVEALERDISRAETLLQEHNVKTRKGTGRLLFHQLSTEDSRHYRHFGSVNGKVLYGPPCRGSWSITRASYAPPETVFNIMRNSSKCCDTCSHSYVTISRWLPGLPSIWLSRNRTTWLSSWPGNKRTWRTVHNNPIMMAWMRLIVMILAPVLLPQLAVAAGHCLDIKHLVYMPIGHEVLKFMCHAKNFHVPSYYLYKSCKAYVYYWKK